MKKIKERIHPKVIITLKKIFKSEMDEILRIQKLLNYKGGTMLDVGAMNGSSFLPFAFADWIIYTFEPDNDNYSFVKKLIEKWNLKNVHLIKEALSNKVEELEFYKSNSSKGIPSLLKFDDGHEFSHKLTTTTLKEFLRSNNIKEVDFLKIDCEGYDLMVLEGMDFEYCSARVIMCEFEDKKSVKLNYETKDLSNLLLNQGYYLVYSIWEPISKYGGNHKWIKFSTNIEDVGKDNWGNIIAFKIEDDFNKFLAEN